MYISTIIRGFLGNSKIPIFQLPRYEFFDSFSTILRKFPKDIFLYVWTSRSCFRVNFLEIPTIFPELIKWKLIILEILTKIDFQPKIFENLGPGLSNTLCLSKKARQNAFPKFFWAFLGSFYKTSAFQNHSIWIFWTFFKLSTYLKI